MADDMQLTPLFVPSHSVTTISSTLYEPKAQTSIAKSSDTHTRLTRWELLREAQKLLLDERVAFCMRRTKASTVDILYNPTHQSAHYDGLMVSSSFWVCPKGSSNSCGQAVYVSCS